MDFTKTQVFPSFLVSGHPKLYVFNLIKIPYQQNIYEFLLGTI